MNDMMPFVTAAKAIIYDEKRMEQLIGMLDSPVSAMQAVQSVIGAIEQKKPVPPRMAPLLGMGIFLLLVDCAQEVTGEEPDPDLVQTVAQKILNGLRQNYKGA